MNEFKKLIARALQEKNAKILLQEGHTTEIYTASGQPVAVTKGPVWAKKKLHMVLNFLHADPEMLKIAKQQGPVKARFEVPGHYTVYVISGVDTSKKLWIRLFLGEDAKAQFMTSFKALSAPQRPAHAAAEPSCDGASSAVDVLSAPDEHASMMSEEAVASEFSAISKVSAVSEDNLMSAQSLPSASAGLKSAELPSNSELVAAGSDEVGEVEHELTDGGELDDHADSAPASGEVSQLEASYIVQAKDRSARLEKEFRDQVEQDAQMQAQAELSSDILAQTGEGSELSPASSAHLPSASFPDDDEGVRFSQLSSDMYGVSSDDGFYDDHAETARSTDEGLQPDISSPAGGAGLHHDAMHQEFEEQKLTEAEQVFSSSFQLDSDSYVGKLISDDEASPEQPVLVGDEGLDALGYAAGDDAEDDNDKDLATHVSQGQGPLLSSSRAVNLVDQQQPDLPPPQELIRQDEVAAGGSVEVDQAYAMQWHSPPKLEPSPPISEDEHLEPLAAEQLAGRGGTEFQNHQAETSAEASSPRLSLPLMPAAPEVPDAQVREQAADADQLALEGFLFETVSKLQGGDEGAHDVFRHHPARDLVMAQQHAVDTQEASGAAAEGPPSFAINEYLHTLVADQIRAIRLVSWGPEHMQALVGDEGASPAQVQSLPGREAAQLRQYITAQQVHGQSMIAIPCLAADASAATHPPHSAPAPAALWAQFWLKPLIAPSGAVAMLVRRLREVASILPSSYQQAAAQVAAAMPSAAQHGPGHLVCLSAASAYGRAQLGYGLIEELVQSLDGAPALIATLEPQGFFTAHHGGLYRPVFLTSQPALWSQQCLDVAEYMLAPGGDDASARRILFISGLPQELVGTFVQHTLGLLLASGVTVIWGLQAPSAYLGWRQISDALAGGDTSSPGHSSLLSTVVSYLRGFIGVRELTAPVREMAQQHLETLVLSSEHKALWQQHGSQLQPQEFYGDHLQSVSLEAKLCAQLKASPSGSSLTLAQVCGLVQHPDYLRQLTAEHGEDMHVSVPVSGAA